ncbi:M48 family metallopeptidase [Commensalibacter nepenthis]|uniref:SprT family zinc-dependent metalloprotease n=1 Tax=Commensalibacter nepenthis TaxID=3043872 RepID=A0ABT6Q6P6_9PROT|nr:SprT family zinc-dependent metalloprotease [Commensalibacter sp. TBRC 10068]MDI2112562.1 SprT family zinc-dependent metalloprotease [Commensalibacter sp. TBRC 10068]
MAVYPKKFNFTYHGYSIPCELYPPHPLTKKPKISLSITAGYILKIRAPQKTSHTDLIAILEKHAPKIFQRIEKQQTQQNKQEKLQFTQSEKHPFLGQYYPLNISENVHHKPNVQLIDNTLQINLRQNTPSKIEHLLDSWYHFQALELFSKRILVIKPSIPWIDWENQPPILRIKRMTSRWGSYIHRSPNIITLNQHLIKAPLPCIDYVIIHELCHAKELNHSKKFYALVANIMPDWKIYQSQLKEHSSLLLYNAQPKAEDKN